MSTYTGPVNSNPADGDAEIELYLYDPWLAQGIIGALTFAIACGVNLWWTIRKKGTRWFHAMLMLGSLCEVGGYVARIMGHNDPYKIHTFIAEYFLIVIAPIPISAAIYLVLTYASKTFPNGRKLLLIPPNYIMWIFVAMDMATIAVQVTGAALVGKGESDTFSGVTPPVNPATAENILLAGLAVQTASFGCFIILLVTAITRVNKIDLTPKLTKLLRRLLFFNFASAILVLLRTSYRLAVEAQGYFGKLNQSQVLFLCLEYLPIILAVSIWTIFPVSRFLNQVTEDAIAESYENKETSLNTSAPPYEEQYATHV